MHMANNLTEHGTTMLTRQVADIVAPIRQKT